MMICLIDLTDEGRVQEGEQDEPMANKCYDGNVNAVCRVVRKMLL